jgi:Tol biopolymer transport system component
MTGSMLTWGGRTCAAVAMGLVAGVLVVEAEAVAPERTSWGASTVRVSVGPGGRQANGVEGPFFSAISRHGRYVAFSSDSSNLVAGDTNGALDVFVRDRLRGVTQRVSVGPNGRQGNRQSYSPEMSLNGRYVAFSSRASNLVAGDTNRDWDVFVRDRFRKVTRRVSVAPGGREPNSESLTKAISGSGRFIAFGSAASNLVPGDTNRDFDVFIRDMAAGVTRRVSVGRGGREPNSGSLNPAISRHGRYVAFSSEASNLVAHDTNNAQDVFVRDTATRKVRRVSISTGGRQGNGFSGGASISASGRFVAFFSEASSLVRRDSNEVFDVFVHDRRTGGTRRVSVGPSGRQANDFSEFPAISADGRLVVYHSLASNLVARDTNEAFDVFVRDRRAGVTRRASVGAGGRQGNSHSFDSAISADGRHIAFASEATNLVPRDTNRVGDMFVRDRAGNAAKFDLRWHAFP